MPVATQTNHAGRQELTPAAQMLINDRKARADRAARALNGDADAPAVAPRHNAPEEAQRPAEKHAAITIDVAPDGIHIKVEYVGALASIPAAIERLKADGVLELVQASRVAPAAPAPAGMVDPWYNPAGEACCPVHRKALSDGVRGLFCSAKAKDGQVADKKGYCGLKFND